MNEAIIAYVDKSVVKIRGLQVKGLKPFELEKKVEEQIDGRVRVIGVTGESIEMDIYGLDPEAIYANEKGIVQALSLTEGIVASDVVKIDQAEKIVEVDYRDIPTGEYIGCARERWLR
uniref:hypothetical protein n=1 Tax=Ndongobacter massiliensis TaxID=1871025 RepID=UPI0009317583|nr:hypothetical protein [Ndongobacter massiliensis]